MIPGNTIPEYVAAILLACCFTTMTDPARAQFRDASGELGFSGGGKAAFADYDNDGFVDLHAGKLFHNEGGKKLVAVADSGVPGGEVVWGDFDNDGNIRHFSIHRQGFTASQQG